MRGRGADRGAIPFDSALQIDRENPFSVNTDWGKIAVTKGQSWPGPGPVWAPPGPTWFGDCTWRLGAFPFCEAHHVSDKEVTCFCVASMGASLPRTINLKLGFYRDHNSKTPRCIF